MSWSIELRGPDGVVHVVRVRAPVDIGREVDGIVVDDQMVSRRHARLELVGSALVITDLGSTNGTTVNDVFVNGPVELHAGDRVGVGPATFVVRDDDIPWTAGPGDDGPHEFGTVTIDPPGTRRSPPTVPGPDAPPPGPAHDQTDVHPYVQTGRMSEGSAPVPPLPPLAAPGDAPAPAPLPAPAAPPPAAPPTAAPPPAAPPPAAPPPAAPPPAAPSPPAAAPWPGLESLAEAPGDAAVIRFVPGSAAAAQARAMAAAAKRGRRHLAGFGSEPWGVRPQICLIDPYPDPERPGQFVTEGTVVDAARNAVWIVVLPEAGAEPLERPLALLFGGAFPAAAEVAPFVEAYGLHVGGAPDPDGELRELALPPLVVAEGPLAAAMALSFVRWLVTSRSDEDVRRFLGSAQPGRLDDAAQACFGAGLPQLEMEWRRNLQNPAEGVSTRQFLRLAATYLRPHVRREAETVIYMVLSLAFTLAFPFALRRLLDSAIPSGEFREVAEVLAFLGAIFVISMLANLRRQYLSAYVGGSVVRTIRTDMFNRLQRLGPRWYTHHQEGDVLSRMMSDVAVLEQGLSATLREGAFQLLSLVVSFVVLFGLDWRLALIVAAGAPAVGLVYRAMAKGAERRSIATQEATAGVFGVAAENYQAQAVVKAFALEDREGRRFQRTADRLFEATRRLVLFGGLFGLSVNLVVTALRIVVLGLGAWLIFEGHLTIGGLVAFTTLMGEAIQPVTQLTEIGTQVQAATGALLRIREVLDADPDVADRPGAVELAPLSREIRFDHVGFAYSPERRTLEDVSVTIPAGSRVAFVGPTGAGKSSVLQLLMRFYDVDDGGVTLDGVDVRAGTVASLRRQIGVVFQETFLFDASIRENISLGRPGASDAEIVAAATAAELHDFVVSLPSGYDTPVGERGGRLSGGQRQRLAIARALLREPRILVLDEATSALDPRTERLIADTLERVSAGRTTVAVTHRLTSITDYDHIVVMVDGRAAEQGTHAELLALDGVYRNLWDEQTGSAIADADRSDVAAALGRVALFADLDPAVLTDLAGRLEERRVTAGTIIEEDGALSVVRRGRGVVLGPGLAGQPVPVGELGPGDTFGLAAVLGGGAGTALQATDTLTLAVLDADLLRAVAQAQPTVAAGLTGRRASVAPTGQRLSRLTFGTSSRRLATVAGPEATAATGATGATATGAAAAVPIAPAFPTTPPTPPTPPSATTPGGPRPGAVP